MPYTRRRRRAPARRPRRKPYGTKASFMPRALAMKRYNQVSTKCFYFKSAGQIASNPDGVIQFSWTTTTAGGGVGGLIPSIPFDFERVSQAYTEYKVLAIKVRLFAANVGAELLATGNPVTELARGNTCLFKDQNLITSEPFPDSITEVINYGSAKLIPSRTSKWTTTMYRPKGLPEWGQIDDNIPDADKKTDPWNGGIFMLSTNCTGGRVLWFYQATYKVVFRGRNYVAPV